MSPRLLRTHLPFVLGLVLSGNSHLGFAKAKTYAEQIYTGGDIVTVSETAGNPEALAIADGKILAIGSQKQIEKLYRGPKTKLVSLAGKTLLPGFIDAHSHYFSSLSVAHQANVYAPPAGPAKDVDTLIATLKAFKESQKIGKGEIIQAYGYDDTVMPGGRLLNRDDLDAAFPDNPVLVGHVSMHGAVLNSRALEKWGITASTPTPPGGIIVRKPGTEEPWGLIMETAFLPIFAHLPKPSADEEVAWSLAGQKLYAEAGITTAHEGATHADELALMKRAAKAGAHLIDIVAFPFITDLDAVLKENPVQTWGTYRDGLKIGGVKITIDGSPQGRTAFFRTPYLTGGPSGEKDWRGELSFPETMITQMVKRVYGLGVPLNLHANGDAAIDVFLKAHQEAAADDPTRDRHVTMIHSQFVHPEQLDSFVRFHITPSFYTLHTYYFAEAHTANRGAAETQYISPFRDALKKGLHPTNHTDFVVVPLDQMFMLHSAVNRVSRAGNVIGADQRISPLEGLRAMTLDAARQYGEEAQKGSLEKGKLADLVILDKNPLSVDPAAIKDIKVLETIKAGKTIFRR